MGGWENGELFNEYRDSVLQGEKFWRSVAQQCEYMNTIELYT